MSWPEYVFFFFLVSDGFLLSCIFLLPHRLGFPPQDSRMPFFSRSIRHKGFLNIAGSGCCDTFDKCVAQLGWGKANVACCETCSRTSRCLAYDGVTDSQPLEHARIFSNKYAMIQHTIQTAPQRVTHVPPTTCHWTVKSRNSLRM